MLRFFALGLIALPIIEIAIFIKVGQLIGVLPTLMLVLAGVMLGIALLRWQGMSVINQIRGNITTGALPGQAIFNTMVIGFAAMLLILPGFMSDALALMLLIPAVRQWIYRGLSSRVTVVNTASYRGPADPYDPQLRDRGTIDLDEDDYRPR